MSKTEAQAFTILAVVTGAVDIYDPEERMDGDREEEERLCGLVLREIDW